MSNKTNAVYIASIDGKDIYLSSTNRGSKGYRLKRPDGSVNRKRFCNALDYSLDLDKLRETFDLAYHYSSKEPSVGAEFSFTDKGIEYTTNIINVTFKYSVKEFNRINKETYLRVGYSLQNVEFHDHVAFEDGQLVGIQTDSEVEKQCYDLPEYFVFVQHEDDPNGHYEATNGIPTVMTVADIRRWVYENGFNADDIHYVRFKRSAGSARVGRCNFINEKLYSRMNTWSKCGLTIRDGGKIDLAAYESYISLTSSSIIDTLTLDPAGILVVDDYDSVFSDRIMATRVVDGHLSTKPETIDINNTIWDGQSLIESSAMGKYSVFGMVLMRNRFFKSCCFNTNIQQWFEDHGITEISQLNGKTRAKSIKDIWLITTPSSIKYLKFGTLDEWLDDLEPTFGVVKHDKPTHYIGGRMVQTHYQLLNSIQLDKEDVKELLQPSLDYFTALKNDPAVLREHIKFPGYEDGNMLCVKNKNDIVFALMNINDKFPKTRVYAEFVKDLLKSQISNIKKGHILVNGNYSTLCGNPIEMLEFAIGQFDGTSQVGVGNVHLKRFGYGTELVGSRSPHVASGNCLACMNSENAEIDKYMNLTNEICVINSIGENILSRLSGSDFDSDTALFTDNKILLRAVKKNYDNFLVPTMLVSADKIKRYYTNEQKADLDIKTSVNKIGEIVNFSQILNSLMWNNIANGESFEQNMDLYADIAQLDVMTNIEIDKAKKVFEVDNAVELRLLKEKYHLKDDNEKDIRPYFFKHLDTSKGFYEKDKRNYKHHETTMDYLQDIVNGYVYTTRKQNTFGNEPIVTVLDKEKKKGIITNYKQIDRAVELVKKCKSNMAMLWKSGKEMHEIGILADREKYYLVSDLSQLKFNYATAYKIIKMNDMQNEDRYILNLLFYAVLSIPSTMFYEVFDKSLNNISVLVEDDENYDCEYMGVKFRHSTLLQSYTEEESA